MQQRWALYGWYYHHEEAVLGPLTQGELQRLHDSGRLNGSTTVWKGWKKGRDLLLLPACLRDVLPDNEPQGRQGCAA